jgi:hypothetical protein
MAGCLAFDTSTKAIPTGIPLQAAVTWQTYVVFGADPARQGAKVPGLAGRLYLFGSEMDSPIFVPGKAEVRLFVDQPDSGPTEIPLEVWQLDPETLRSKLQHDAIGWGYSLILPWTKYRPDLTHVRLTVRFEPTRGGAPLYAQETRLALHGEGPPQVVSTTTTAAKAPEPVKQ